MSNKWLLAAFGLYPQSLASSTKRELYFPNSFSIRRIGIKTYWTGLEALAAVPASVTRFGPWDMVYG